MSSSYISAALRQQIRERARQRCEYCLLSEEDAYFSHEHDHIIAEKHDFGANTRVALHRVTFWVYDTNRKRRDEAWRKEMFKTIEALFDGIVFHPTEPLTLAPNTRVRMTIETVLPAEGKAVSFLRTARALNLDGPPDWSVNIEEYLYGGDPSDAD